jgi:hypothetical protein
MADPEDLAILWAFFGGLRCVLTPLDGGWQVRVEDNRQTVKSYVAPTSDEALRLADQWLRDYDGGTLPAA